MTTTVSGIAWLHYTALPSLSTSAKIEGPREVRLVHGSRGVAGSNVQMRKNLTAIDRRRRPLQHRAALIHDEVAIRDAFGEGWMYKIKVTGGAPGDLLSAADYEKLVASI